MSAPRRAQCPTCKKPVRTERENRPADFPFCSERCRLLDLSKWLRGEYGIPAGAPASLSGESGSQDSGSQESGDE